MSGDLTELLASGADFGVVDLTDVPMTCDICPDVETHVRLTTAARARDADDLRGLMQVLGLVPSPPPVDATTNGWGKRRPSRKRNHSKENQ